MTGPRLEIIGDLLGAVVMIDRESRSVFIVHEGMPPIKISIDHPYIQGTKLEREARRAFGEQARKEWPPRKALASTERKP
jgi:hypothetical protein